METTSSCAQIIMLLFSKESCSAKNISQYGLKKRFEVKSLVLLLSLSLNTNLFSQNVLGEKYVEEKNIIRMLIEHSSSSVNGEACNIQHAKVIDFLTQYVLFTSLGTGEGKKWFLKCEDRRGQSGKFVNPQNCRLEFGESIKLPAEPTGWTRALIFSYDFGHKILDSKSFRCIDIP